ncbi:MAG TPA: MarR family transcriptional regulator [Candidatus Limnocylindrales bacterium]|nr:MarR family transcriptional regulator [Candidatus Limnocylindrales bacterium]
MGTTPSSEPFYSHAAAALQVITYKKVQNKINAILKQYGLNTTQWIILGKLDEKRSGLRATDLARFMHVEVPLVTMVSQPLLGRGLIDSVVPSHDKRTKLLRITSQAHDMVKVIEQKLQRQFADIVKDVSAQDLQAYFKVLNSMMANVA